MTSTGDRLAMLLRDARRSSDPRYPADELTRLAASPGCPRIDSAEINVNGLRTHYLIAGTGRPIVLVHGGGSGAVAWRSVIAPLAHRFQVVAPDLVGFGETDKPRASYDRAFFSSWLSGFLDALGLARCSIVGHSLGGAIAVQFALDHPSRLDRLGVASPAGFGVNVPLVPLILSLMFEIAPGLATARCSHTQCVKDPGCLDEALLMYAAAVCRRPGGRRAILRGQIKPILPFRMEELASLRMPVMVVWGADDRVFSARRGERVARALPLARFELIRDAGHIPFYDQPDAFVSALIDFLEAS